MAAYNQNRWDGWMRAALMGDRESYRLLLEDLRHWLLAYFSRRVDRAAAEDLVQDSLLTLHNKRQTYDPTQPVGPWVATIARHRLIDYLRRSRQAIDVELDENMAEQDPAGDPTAGRDVETLLKTIPTAQADVIRLVKLQDVSIEDAARQTGHSPSSVKVMIHRGMKKLMAMVKGQNDAP